MFTTVAAVTAEHAGHWGGPPFWPFFLFFPLTLLLIVGLVFALVRRRRFGAYGPPWAQGYGPGSGVSAARSAERVLAERFAKGDIDETEYRARLEVLRADRPDS